jgi:hypothetical protein
MSDNSAGGWTAFEKVGRKLRFPDNFCQSQTEFDNFRPDLRKNRVWLQRPLDDASPAAVPLS